MKKLKIAQVAPLWLTIPPQAYGGIERIVAMLCDGLVDKGHEVTLFAAPGSKTKAKLISVLKNRCWKRTFPGPTLSGICAICPKRTKWPTAANLTSSTATWTSGGFFHNLTKVPTLHTMHNPLYRTNADATKDDRLRLFTEEGPERTSFLSVVPPKSRRW